MKKIILVTAFSIVAFYLGQAMACSNDNTSKQPSAAFQAWKASVIAKQATAQTSTPTGKKKE